MAKKAEQHPAQGKGSAKRGITRSADKGVIPQKSRFRADPTNKAGQEATTRNARGMWKQQGRKDATIKGDADHQNPQ